MTTYQLNLMVTTDDESDDTFEDCVFDIPFEGNPQVILELAKMAVAQILKSRGLKYELTT